MVNVRSLWYQTISLKVNEVEVVSSLRSSCLQGDDFNVMSWWLGSGARLECVGMDMHAHSMCDRMGSCHPGPVSGQVKGQYGHTASLTMD